MKNRLKNFLRELPSSMFYIIINPALVMGLGFLFISGSVRAEKIKPMKKPEFAWPTIIKDTGWHVTDILDEPEKSEKDHFTYDLVKDKVHIYREEKYQKISYNSYSNSLSQGRVQGGPL